MTKEAPEGWYIVKEATDKPCRILSAQALASQELTPAEQWGPFEAKNQAIAKRVGLIRAGKCKPS
ncbi:MAG: DDE transposase family protein [Cyanobacteria bacterium P01_D01_bin.105]